MSIKICLNCKKDIKENCGCNDKVLTSSMPIDITKDGAIKCACGSHIELDKRIDDNNLVITKYVCRVCNNDIKTIYKRQ